MQVRRDERNGEVKGSFAGRTTVSEKGKWLPSEQGLGGCPAKSKLRREFRYWEWQL